MSFFDSIYADTLLPPMAVSVYMYLKDRSNAGDTCWPSIRRIAEDLKLSRRTVQRALTDLERHGFLERTHRRRPNGSLTSNLYHIAAGKGKSAPPAKGEVRSQAVIRVASPWRSQKDSLYRRY